MKCKSILKKRFKEETTVTGKINYCMNSLSRVKATTVNNTDFNSSNIGGLYSYYKPVIQQARAIMSLNFQNNPAENGAAENKYIYTIPYSINMETLFEYYARTELYCLS